MKAGTPLAETILVGYTPTPEGAAALAASH